MVDLFFKHDVSLAIGFGKAIEARAGEILAGVPDKIATRLLARPDVVVADPSLDVRRFEFADPRKHSKVVADSIAPPIDHNKLIADEKRIKESDDARKALAARAQAEEETDAKANAKAASDAKAADDAARKTADDARKAAERKPERENPDRETDASKSADRQQTFENRDRGGR